MNSLQRLPELSEAVVKSGVGTAVFRRWQVALVVGIIDLRDVALSLARCANK